jgi:hypothetical protein
MLSALSSVCCCGPTALRCSNFQFTMPLSFAPASQWHQEIHFLHQSRIIRPTECPRFVKPGLLFFPMVHNLAQPPSATLRGSASTIPPLDFDLPFLLFYPHRPYHSLTTTRRWNGHSAKHEDSSFFLTAHGFVLHKNPNTCASILGATFLHGGGAAVGQNYKKGCQITISCIKGALFDPPQYRKN